MDGLHLPLNKRYDTNIASTHRARRRLASLAAPLSCILLPTVLVAFYYLVLAAPQYVSHADFVVRGQGNQSSSMLSSLLTSGGNGMATEDTYVVQDYMMSRDAARLLLKDQDLAKVFNRPSADFLSRFPGPGGSRTFEHFFHYYVAHVNAELDTTSEISTLTVRTFRADDSQRIAQALLVAAEKLVNDMNQRQRQNLIGASQREVEESETKLRNVALAIQDYRNRQSMLDPTKQSVPMLKELSDLQSMLTTTKVQLAQIENSTPGSPLITVYKRRLAALQAQIQLGNGDVAGPSTSLVPKITAFDDLTLQRDLAEKELTIANASLQSAKAQADRQLMYLEEVTKPDLPDYPAYPRSAVAILVALASFTGLYFLASLIISGIREHRLS